MIESKKSRTLYQYSCPACGYTLYSESISEELYCQNKSCNKKNSILHIKNEIISEIIEDSTTYIVTESFMVDHGCCEVRPIKKGTEVEVVKIKNDWYSCVTEEGLSFFIQKNKLKRKEKYQS